MAVTTNSGELIGLTQGAWMTVSFVTLMMISAFTVQRFFIVSFIGLLSVMQLYAPTDDHPDWWALLRVISLVGFVVFGYIVYARVIEFI